MPFLHMRSFLPIAGLTLLFWGNVSFAQTVDGRLAAPSSDAVTLTLQDAMQRARAKAFGRSAAGAVRTHDVPAGRVGAGGRDP